MCQGGHLAKRSIPLTTPTSHFRVPVVKALLFLPGSCVDSCFPLGESRRSFRLLASAWPSLSCRRHLESDLGLSQQKENSFLSLSFSACKIIENHINSHVPNTKCNPKTITMRHGYTPRLMNPFLLLLC